MYRRYLIFAVLGMVGLCLLAAVAYNLPPIHDRLAWRVDNLRVQINRAINPPEEVVFVPQEQVDAIVNATLTAMAPTAGATSTPISTGTPLATATASLVPTPIPASISLNGIRHEYQQFNNCAPCQPFHGHVLLGLDRQPVRNAGIPASEL
jgi:hypothetical protein